jgi:hypothetical protein
MKIYLDSSNMLARITFLHICMMLGGGGEDVHCLCSNALFRSKTHNTLVISHRSFIHSCDNDFFHVACYI